MEKTRAVVIGASMAGLSAARVLSDHVDGVVVLERDDVSQAGPAARPHVPQGRHPHLLLTAGVQRLEGWFPGLTQELLDGGAVSLDLCRDFYWYQARGVQARPESSLQSPSMTRPFLEETVRRRVAALSNVDIRGGTTAAGLDLDTGSEKVTGVRLEGGERIAADLVVDCTGRVARTLPWLAELGYDPPRISLVHVDTRYVSRVLRRSGLPPRDWKAAAVIDEPDRKRLAMALPVEGDRWLLLLGGLNGEAAPLDDAAALDYARSLPSPVIAELLQTSEQLGSPVTHRFPDNQRRHVERMRRFPRGWLMLGDAISSFDPIYGQGMSSATLQAEALDRCLHRHPDLGRRFTRSYFRAAARVVANPWSIAVGGDFVYAGTEGKKPPGTDLVNRYMERVTLAGQRDGQVVLRFNEVISLTRRPETLLTPWFVARVLVSARRARRSQRWIAFAGDARSRRTPGPRGTEPLLPASRDQGDAGHLDPLGRQ